MFAMGLWLLGISVVTLWLLLTVPFHGFRESPQSFSKPLYLYLMRISAAILQALFEEADPLEVTVSGEVFY